MKIYLFNHIQIIFLITYLLSDFESQQKEDSVNLPTLMEPTEDY